jgi:ketosteroid isomerase-like protein
MNKIADAFASACALAAALVALPAVASDKTDVMASIQKFGADFNKGDMKAAASVCTDETIIIDNFPPHEWHGTGACTKWAGDLAAFLKDNGITDGLVTILKPRHVDVTGDRAYVVVPTAFKFKMKGKPVTQAGQLTVALQKVGDAWRMTGWAWADQ